jgi:hypothetical protein
MNPEECGVRGNGDGRCLRSDSIDEIRSSIAIEKVERRKGERQILEAIGVLTGEVSALVKRVGSPPDPAIGDEGSGLQRTIWLMQKAIPHREQLDSIAEVEALHARLEERTRYSDRAYADRSERRRLIVAVIVAALSSGILTAVASWLATS